MATFRATAKAFVGGRLVQVGDERESASDPGWPFVPSAQYTPYEDIVERVPTAGGFVIRDGDKLVQVVEKPTRLASRSPHELRPFAKD